MSPEQASHLIAQRAATTPPPYKVLLDGRALWVYAMAFGNGRLCLGRADDLMTFDKAWCYKSLEAAFAAADAWDGSGTPEGWKKDLQTQEYRKEHE